MDVDVFGQARQFLVGVSEIELRHTANIRLEPDEMVTFTDARNREYDVAAKDWGYYATPSLDWRLRRFGMRAALMRNIDNQHTFVVLVYDDAVEAWQSYMAAEHLELVAWLDEMQ